MQIGLTEILMLLLLPLALMLGLGFVLFLFMSMKGKLASAIVSKMADPHCSFCGRPARESEKLIQGQMAFICAECIAHLHNQIESERQTTATGVDLQG
jgi:hypothetical protein